MYSFPTYTIFDEFNQSLLLVVCVWQGVGDRLHPGATLILKAVPEVRKTLSQHV